MRQTFTHYKNGYLLVQLQGFSPERFWNLCMANQIELWNLTQVDGHYEFYITPEGFYKIKPLARKAQARVRIVRKLGLPFFLYRNRMRKLYALGIVCFFLILFVMSRFVWNITLEGNYRFTDDTLFHYLKGMNIDYGVRTSSIDCDYLEESIRTDYPEILWVSARVSGTRLIIKIKENEVMASIPQKSEVPQDLVAEKDGVITSMVVRKGKAKVAIGDQVTKGQVLVEGTIPIRNDAEEIVQVQYVPADADIYAQTRESYRVPVSKIKPVRVDTGDVRYGIRIRLFHHIFAAIFPSKQDLPWEYIRENHQMVLMKDFYLPIWIERITAREYSIYERFLTEAEVEAVKIRINEDKIKKLEKKGVQIIENNVKIISNGSSLEIQGEFLLEEGIGVGKNIEKTEETDQTDERN